MSRLSTSENVKFLSDNPLKIFCNILSVLLKFTFSFNDKDKNILGYSLTTL